MRINIFCMKNCWIPSQMNQNIKRNWGFNLNKIEVWPTFLKMCSRLMNSGFWRSNLFIWRCASLKFEGKRTKSGPRKIFKAKLVESRWICSHSLINEAVLRWPSVDELKLSEDCPLTILLLPNCSFSPLDNKFFMDQNWFYYTLFLSTNKIIFLKSAKLVEICDFPANENPFNVNFAG